MVQGPAAVTRPSRKQVHSTNNPNSSPVPHPTVPVRQRPNKRGGGNFHPPVVPSNPPPPFTLFQMAPNAYPNLLPATADPSMREHRTGRYQPQPRNSSQRSNFVSHQRGEGQRGYGTGRDVSAQSHRANSRSFMRSPPPAPNPPPFLHPAAPGRPFITPLPYPGKLSSY